MGASSTLRSVIAAVSSFYVAPCLGQIDDAAGLFQMAKEPAMTDTVLAEDSPRVVTKLGKIRGRYEDSNYIFKGIPYAEVPERFAAAEMKQPWEGTLDAMKWGDACMGSMYAGKQTSKAVKESEDCLKLTVWVPPGGHKSLPVMVYFHGGQNQRGSAQDELFQGDLITRNKEYPVIFVSFDFRLGLFGWIQGYGATANLGLRDQQMALDWVQKNIAAFGGNPHKVTAWGHSDGANDILAHLVSPQSKGLFHRAILNSPSADYWSRLTNKVRTNYIVKRSGCAGIMEGKAMLRCLRRLSARSLLDAEWQGAKVEEQLGSTAWIKEVTKLQSFERSIELPDDIPTFLGWHAVPDGHIVPAEPKLLIRDGKWNKMPVVITMSKNESMGMMTIDNTAAFNEVISPLFHDYDLAKAHYVSTLTKANSMPKDETSLLHAMITDKVWTCYIRSLAADMARTGGDVRVGMFAHATRYDPARGKVNKECEHGAVCKGSEMYFALPQGRGKGIPSTPTFIGETNLASRYSAEFLKFASGSPAIWEQYNSKTPVTFYDKKGPFVVNGYRAEQCKVLDNSMGEVLPDAHKNARFTSRLPPLPQTTTDQPQMLAKRMPVKKH